MSFLKQNAARHRAHTPSRLVRNTTIAAAAGAAMIGSIVPAQAYAEVPATSAPSYQAPAASPANHASYTYEAPVAPQAAPVAPQAAQPVAATSSVAPQSTATTAVNPAAGGIVGTAQSGVGSAYVYGGTSYGAWDCSGFTQWVYAQNGISIPRTSQAQASAGTPTANPQPGDLVIQSGGGHVGIYLGGGKMISALNPAQGTQVHSVNAMPVSGYVTFR